MDIISDANHRGYCAVDMDGNPLGIVDDGLFLCMVRHMQSDELVKYASTVIKRSTGNNTKSRLGKSGLWVILNELAMRCSDGDISA